MPGTARTHLAGERGGSAASAAAVLAHNPFMLKKAARRGPLSANVPPSEAIRFAHRVPQNTQATSASISTQ